MLVVYVVRTPECRDGLTDVQAADATGHDRVRTEAPENARPEHGHQIESMTHVEDFDGHAAAPQRLDHGTTGVEPYHSGVEAALEQAWNEDRPLLLSTPCGEVGADEEESHGVARSRS
jgi:hypothetical protein